MPTRERPLRWAPRFPGGSDAMLRYFADSCRYPVEAWEKRKEGGVVLATNGVRHLTGPQGPLVDWCAS